MAEKKLGLVLSGGGARGFAHLGVLEVLEEQGVYPSIIAGSSAGSIAGTFYAAGYRPREIVDILMEKSFYQYTNLSNPLGGGIMKLNGMKELIDNKLNNCNLEDLNIPMIVCATNMNKGESTYFTEGPAGERVLASSSIPILFRLVTIDGIQYGDGGLMNNLPAKAVKDKADIILGVNVISPGYEENLGSVAKVALRSFHLGVAANILEEASYCDYFIDMPELMEYGLLKNSQGKKIFDVGYTKAKQYFRENPIHLGEEGS
ncbi:MAG: patatin-like phospholipase family protein [Bacteroidales bacterium]